MVVSFNLGGNAYENIKRDGTTICQQNKNNNNNFKPFLNPNLVGGGPTRGVEFSDAKFGGEL